jgi:hypothetical protein
MFDVRADLGVRSYVIERPVISAVRSRALTRRRRSLSILSASSLTAVLLVFTVGGTLIAIAATGSTVCFCGYLNFLRSQALHDRERRERREHRHSRAADRSRAAATRA